MCENSHWIQDKQVKLEAVTQRSEQTKLERQQLVADIGNPTGNEVTVYKCPERRGHHCY